MEPHIIQFILRTEAMTAADRRLADEQLGRLAQRLWQLSHGVVERWRSFTGRRGRTAGAAEPADRAPAVHRPGTRRTAR